MTIKSEGRDWRSRLEQMHQHRDGIDDCLQVTRTELDKLQAEIARTLEKISSREKYINNQLEEPLTMYKQLSHLLAQSKEQYRQVSGGVVDQFASEEWPLRAGLMSCPAYYSHLICDSSHPHYCPQCTMLGLARGRVIYYLEAKIINYKLSGHKHCTIKVKMCINNIHANRAHFWLSIGQFCP